MTLKRIGKSYIEFMKMIEELTGRKEYFLTTATNRYDSDINLTLLRDLDFMELKEYTEKRFRREITDEELKEIAKKATEEIADKVYRLIDSIIKYCPEIEVKIEDKVFFDCRKIDRILIELHDQFSGYKEERFKNYEGKLLYH